MMTPKARQAVRDYVHDLVGGLLRSGRTWDEISIEAESYSSAVADALSKYDELRPIDAEEVHEILLAILDEGDPLDYMAE